MQRRGKVARWVGRSSALLLIMVAGFAHSGFWANPRKNLTNNFLFNRNTPTPKVPLPEVRGSLPDDLRDTLDTVKFTWLGHATVLASINGKTILFDPVFSESASPV